MAAMFSCSLDDGHPSDMKAAELLYKSGLKATFYVPIRNCEGSETLSKFDLRQISDQFEIGSHTLDHCFLKRLSSEKARCQVIEGKAQLENLIGQVVTGFCYPGGKYRQEHIDLVRFAGFHYARTTMNLRFDTGDQKFELPTTVQFYPHKRSVYVTNFIRGGEWTKRAAGLQLALKYSWWIDRMYGLFEYSLNHGKSFHLWGHSRDIDRLQAWQEFDRFLTYVATKIPPENRVTNEQLAAHYFLTHLSKRCPR